MFLNCNKRKNYDNFLLDNALTTISMLSKETNGVTIFHWAREIEIKSDKELRFCYKILPTVPIQPYLCKEWFKLYINH